MTGHAELGLGEKGEGAGVARSGLWLGRWLMAGWWVSLVECSVQIAVAVGGGGGGGGVQFEWISRCGQGQASDEPRHDHKEGECLY